MKITVIITVLLSAVSLAFAQDCFSSRQQRYTYEQGLASTVENYRITSCLKKELAKKDYQSFSQAVSSLRKSNNLKGVIHLLIDVFVNSKDPQTVFTAATALISAPEESIAFQKDFINELTSPVAPDYKKTLAAVVLIAAEEANGSYTAFLEPALNAKDKALEAYACGAYSLLVPGTSEKYLNPIIRLYAFDKTFAQKAFASTGLSQSVLNARLVEDYYSQEQALRLAAIEWIGDSGNKKLLVKLLSPQVSKTKEGPTLSAAANALLRNYAAISVDLRKALKKDPASESATVAVMTYSFMGSRSYEVITPLLSKGSDNEISNALRIITSITGILDEDPSYYPNPGLEKQRLTKLIAPVAQAGKNAQSAEVKLYAQSAAKELYRFLNGR